MKTLPGVSNRLRVLNAIKLREWGWGVLEVNPN